MELRFCPFETVGNYVSPGVEYHLERESAGTGPLPCGKLCPNRCSNLIAEKHNIIDIDARVAVAVL
jgi:hypothetical protein